MLALIITIVVVILVLIINELWWRIKKPNDEISRKAFHIVVASYVAFWPYYLGWTEIELIGAVFFVAVLIAKNLKASKVLRTVQKPTWGQMFFALSVTGVALVTHDKLIYMTALLSMGLADGLAAVVGSYFGKSTNYSIFDHTKSLVGSLTFYVAILLLLANYHGHTHGMQNGAEYLVLALLATALENLPILGVDNLLVPMLIAFWLR